MMAFDENKDYVSQYRKDIKNGFPVYIVKTYVERQIIALEALPDATGDKEEAIRQLSDFLKELTVPSETTDVEVWVMEWEESEAGWGTRPDGFTVHVSEQAYRDFLGDYWRRQPNNVPDEYSRPCWDAPVKLAVDSGHALVARMKSEKNWTLAHSEETREIRRLVAERLASENKSGPSFRNR